MIRVLPLLVVTLFASEVSFAGETLRIWIANSAKQNIFAKIEDPFEKETGIKIIDARTKETRDGNVVTYFRDLLAGKVDASTNSGSFEDSLKIVRKEAPEITDAQFKEIIFRVIGRDLFNVLSNPRNGKASLTLAEVESIFTGKISNWKEIGGTDLPIRIYYAKLRIATNSAFQKAALQGKQLTTNMINVPDYKDILAAVEKEPGAIGFGPTDLKSSAVTLVSTPPIGRPITMFTKGIPSKKMLLLYDFIAKSGKKYGIGN